MLSPRGGVISSWDDLFRRHAATVGWDWRLLAAQCYQESAFDPQAVSWAGARGLMQIMPATADHLGLPRADLHNPERNIEAATRYLRELTTLFADIRDPRERICFVLAAYNGGHGHVRDAMTLARKHGRNPQRWDDVDPYIRALANPAYYRDPAVRFGFLRGSETSGYVRNIRARWNAYRGAAKPAPTWRPAGAASKVRPRSDFINDTTAHQ
ncbi:MAG: transglycosylase SLT domain-containing protein [Bacteroidaceae bacterium]|nr:transglycosylase SLT domain-containing protein [Bacteroidaceae bacterium]